MRCSRIVCAGDTGERVVPGGCADGAGRVLPRSGGVRSRACQDARLTAVATAPTLRTWSLQFPLTSPGKYHQAIVLKE